MDLRFENRSVERFFTNFKLMKIKLGEDLTRSIKRRYDQLKAAPNFSAYLNTRLGRPHALVGDPEGCYSVNLSKNMRLIIKGVVDYHGQKHEWLIP